MNKQILKSYFNKNRNIIVYTLIFLFIFYCFFTLRGIKLNTINDKIFQYDLFYKEWYRLLDEFFRGNGFPVYSWNMYLGSDFFSSMNYYVIGDFFIILFYPLYSLGVKLDSLLTLEIYMCIFLSSFNFYLFLKESHLNNNNDIVNVCLSLIYAFGGFAVLFYGQYMYHRSYCLLPFLFYSVEKYFNNKKLGIFIFAVFLLFIQNFYFMYPISIFLAIYCVTRLCAKNYRIKSIVNVCFILFLAYIIGFLLSAFITIPGIYYIIYSPRLSIGKNHEILWPYRTIVQFFLSFVSSPFPLFTNINNIFAKSDYYAYWFSNYIGIIPFIYSLFFCRIKCNRPYAISLIVVLLFALIKPLSSFMHGFSEPSMRWCFIISFYFLYLCARGFDNGVNISNSFFFLVLIISVLLMISVFIIDHENIYNYYEQLLCFGLSTILSLLVVLVYYKSSNIALFINYIGIFIFTVFLINTYVSGRQNICYDRINKNSLKYYESIDDDLIFRWYIDETHIPGPSPMNFNNNLYVNVMANRSYSSTYDYNISKFDQINDASVSNDAFRQISDPYSLTAIGTKYWIVLDENELPKELDFEFLSNIDDMKIYKNLNYMGFGFTLSEIKNINELRNKKEFLSTIFIDDDIDYNKYINLSFSKFDITNKGNNYLIGHINLDDNNILFIPIPNTKGWELTVNGIKQNIINVNGGFIGVELNKGYSEIHLSFSSPFFKEGAIISFITAIILFYYIVLSNRKLKYLYN